MNNEMKVDNNKQNNQRHKEACIACSKCENEVGSQEHQSSGKYRFHISRNSSPHASNNQPQMNLRLVLPSLIGNGLSNRIFQRVAYAKRQDLYPSSTISRSDTQQKIASLVNNSPTLTFQRQAETVSNWKKLSSILFKGDPTLESVINGETNLLIGAKGLSIARVQQALVSLRYLEHNDMDADFGPKTQKAIRSFQSIARSLPNLFLRTLPGGGVMQDGVIDTNTLYLLDLMLIKDVSVARSIDLGPHTSSPAKMLDWEKIHTKISQNQGLREVFEEKLQVEIEESFGAGVDLNQLLKEIKEAEANGDEQGALEKRIKLFKANEYAVVETLRVDLSSRYQPAGDSTYCNVYAYDVVTAMGGYLPRVWWTEDALSDIARGKIPKPELNVTVREMTANKLTLWMHTYGGLFGWKKIDDIDAAQGAANRGKLVILLVGTTGESGHVSVVLPEKEGYLAVRSGGKVIEPVQSQAGGTLQISLHEAKSVGWMKQPSQSGGQRWGGEAWVFEGEPRSPLLTPEEIGNRPDMRFANIDILLETEYLGLPSRIFREYIYSDKVKLTTTSPSEERVMEKKSGNIVVTIRVNLILSSLDRSISCVLNASLYRHGIFGEPVKEITESLKISDSQEQTKVIECLLPTLGLEMVVPRGEIINIQIRIQNMVPS